MVDRVNLEYLDLICEALDCDLSEILVREPNSEPQITHYRAGTRKKGVCNVQPSAHSLRAAIFEKVP